MHWNGKVGSLLEWTLQKIPIISKNSSNKNCSKINFLQTTHWTHISISPRSGARGLQRLPFLKYYYVLESECGFTLLGMDALIAYTSVSAIQVYAFTEFLLGNLILKYFCFMHFLISLVFFVAFSPKVILLSHSSTLKYLKKWQTLEAPSSTLEGDKDMRLMSFLQKI